MKGMRNHIRLKMDVGSGVWISQEVKIILENVGYPYTDIVLGFPGMDEVGVDDVIIEGTLGLGVKVFEDALLLPDGVYGRNVSLCLKSEVEVGSFAFRVVLSAVDFGQNATLDVFVEPESQMTLI